MRSRKHPLEARIRALEIKSHEDRRRAFVDEMERTGRVTDDERAAVERAFDGNPEATVALISGRPPRPVAAQAFTDAEDRTYRAAASARLGLDPKGVV
jgi:hypothetical protein